MFLHSENRKNIAEKNERKKETMNKRGEKIGRVGICQLSRVPYEGFTRNDDLFMHRVL